MPNSEGEQNFWGMPTSIPARKSGEQNTHIPKRIRNFNFDVQEQPAPKQPEQDRPKRTRRKFLTGIVMLTVAAAGGTLYLATRTESSNTQVVIPLIPEFSPTPTQTEKNGKMNEEKLPPSVPLQRIEKNDSSLSYVVDNLTVEPKHALLVVVGPGATQVVPIYTSAQDRSASERNLNPFDQDHDGNPEQTYPQNGGAEIVIIAPSSTIYPAVVIEKNNPNALAYVGIIPLHEKIEEDKKAEQLKGTIASVVKQFKENPTYKNLDLTEAAKAPSLVVNFEPTAADATSF